MAGNGNKGGKGGVGYTSVGSAYSREEIKKALHDAGLSKGVKGHGKGKHGSGESAQTKKENKQLVEQLRSNRQAAKHAKKQSRIGHEDKGHHPVASSSHHAGSDGESDHALSKRTARKQKQARAKANKAAFEASFPARPAPRRRHTM
jgi:hypothetical protein